MCGERQTNINLVTTEGKNEINGKKVNYHGTIVEGQLLASNKVIHNGKNSLLIFAPTNFINMQTIEL